MLYVEFFLYIVFIIGGIIFEIDWYISYLIKLEIVNIILMVNFFVRWNEC